MKTIMLCLNQLGIGGIETAVLQQTIQLIKRKYRVLILAEDGIYRRKFEKEGAIFLNFEHTVQNNYDMDKINKVMKIIEEYKVEQVHIHQFYCIAAVFPACILKRVPYIAWLHLGIKNVYDWFEKCFPCYKVMFSIYFHNATKIIAISESAKQENIEKYNVDEKKYIVKKNSIDFSAFKVEGNSIPQKIERFLIIGRFAKEKEKSIKNAILLFKEFHKESQNAILTIVGDGELKENIENEIHDIKDIVEILGPRNDIPQIISKHDIVIALDRCILEAITMKKLAIISGYDTLKELVTQSNIEKASNENFGGENLNENTIEELIKQLQSLSKDEIKNIVEQNYKFAYENLNIEKNVYILEEMDYKCIQIDIDNTIESIIKLQNMYDEQIHYTDKIYSECKEAEKWYQDQIKIRDEQIEELRNEKEKIEEKIKKSYFDKVYNIYKKMRYKGQ